MSDTKQNGLGLAGFICVLVSFLSCGSLGIVGLVGLVLCAVAVFRQPRGFAIAGLAIGLFQILLGIALLVLFFFGLLAPILALVGLEMMGELP